MRIVFRIGATAVGIALLLLAEDRVCGYFPGQCDRECAKDDFQKAAAVVIGRVTAIQRYRFAPEATSGASAKPPAEFFYLATITVGRTLKGKAKPGDEILFYVGLYGQREEDNATPAPLRVANTHPAWTVECNHVYLLALDPAQERRGGRDAEERRDGKWVRAGLEKREIWEPRSCHWGVHEITVYTRDEPAKKGPDGRETTRRVCTPYATIYFDRWNKPWSGEGKVPLDEFIAAQTNGKLPQEKPSTTPSLPSR
jgi:hypothetical protein